MKISVITAWGSEPQLAPYFCRHYAYADEILVLMGPGECEETIEILSKFPNTHYRLIEYPDGKWDMYRKQKELSWAAHNEAQGEWVILVDADEFVFPMAGDKIPIIDPRVFLGMVNDGNVLCAFMWHVYRNVEDTDLDPERAPLFQRRHGDPEIEHHYIKPIVVKPNESHIEWHIGAHRYFDNEHLKVSSKRFAGVHWHWADADIAIARHNMTAGRIISKQQWLTDPIDENVIRARCDAHRNDPRLF